MQFKGREHLHGLTYSSCLMNEDILRVCKQWKCQVGPLTSALYRRSTAGTSCRKKGLKSSLF